MYLIQSNFIINSVTQFKITPGQRYDIQEIKQCVFKYDTCLLR